MLESIKYVCIVFFNDIFGEFGDVFFVVLFEKCFLNR